MSPRWDKPGTTREQLDAASDRILRGDERAEDYRPRQSTLTEIAASKPWYRRAWAFISDGHRFLVGLASICASTIGVHAWMAGLVTKDNVRAEVESAVTKAMLETRGDISDLKDHTSGIVDWRRDTSKMVLLHEERIKQIGSQQEKLETRFDRYLGRR